MPRFCDCIKQTRAKPGGALQTPLYLMNLLSEWVILCENIFAAPVEGPQQRGYPV